MTKKLHKKGYGNHKLIKTAIHAKYLWKKLCKKFLQIRKKHNIRNISFWTKHLEIMRQLNGQHGKCNKKHIAKFFNISDELLFSPRTPFARENAQLA